MGDPGSPQPSTSKENTGEETILEGWSKEEKFDLFQGLKNIGSHDAKSIHDLYLPTKTPVQIQSAIKHYKSIALKNRSPRKGGRPKTDVNIRPNLPLSHWAKYLMENIGYNDLQTEIATALRLIAEFENIPQAYCTELIDFRKAYQLLANAVEGKDLKEDKLLTMMITKCIVETALTGKVFIKNTTVKQIVDTIQIRTDKDIRNFPKPLNNKELAIVQHLAEQRNYNPLNITENHLRATDD